ncbi:MAG TPA: aspartyl protease family protein [Tepidisphaeraceae bacterium]|nr:aspartyl protease family protein [Tepidisphaeraceae bacterium]
MSCALSGGAARAASALATRPAVMAYPMIRDVKVVGGQRISALPMISPPINGFVPRVVMGISTENDPEDALYAAQYSSAPAAGTQLPLGQSPRYVVATFDSGAQSNILSHDAYQSFNFAGGGRAGSNFAQVVGANGTEDVQISDAVGVYVTGLGNATSNGTSITAVAPGTLTGQKNVSVLSAEQGSVLPNILGAPTMSMYQTVIRNSVPRKITVGGQTLRSPDVSFRAVDTTINEPNVPYVRLTLDVMSGQGVSSNASFFPDPLGIFMGQEPTDNPVAPTFWMNMFAKVNMADGANAVSDRQFLFDTGAQVTVLSQDTAAEMGFYSAGPDASTPDFHVEVLGVGGVQQVPGFYLDQLKVMTNGGPLAWSNVPVLVLDLPDPRDNVGFVPGVLGTNLFDQRDLILNGGLTNPSVSLSPEVQWWANADGNWSDAAKWMLGVPDSDEKHANFLRRATAPRAITVDQDFAVHDVRFDNAHRYTLNGPGRITVRSTDPDNPAHLTVDSGSHTISAPITLASDASIVVRDAASVLTMPNDVTATGVALTKAGAGTAEMKNVRAAALKLEGGKLVVLQSGAPASTSVVNDITATGGGAIDLKNNALIVRGAGAGGSGALGAFAGGKYTGVTGLLASGRNAGTARGAWDGEGIVTSMPAASPSSRLTALGVATAGELAKTTFAGVNVSAADVLVMYSYAGDADLNGRINGDDYFRIDSHANAPGAHGWANGDFDYSGKIDGDDYFLIDSNIARQSAGLLAATTTGLAESTLTPIPEPAAATLLTLATLATTRRRRRPV